MTTPGGSLHHLRAAGTSVLLDARGPGLPALVHWGPDLGDATSDDLAALADAAVPATAQSALEVPVPASLSPERSAGFRGRPTGRSLAVVGLRLPVLDPEQALLLGRRAE